MKTPANTPIQYTQYTAGQWKSCQGKSITEASVSLTVNGQPWLSFMCTPVDLEALAVGFLFNEGLLQSASEIASVRVCDQQDNVDVWLNHAVEKPIHWQRTSGCTGGVTSVRGQLEVSHNPIQPVPEDIHFIPAQIMNLMTQLLAAQDLYQESGGVHSSALSDGNRLVLIAEDVGRHNTLDKIAGRCLLEHVQLTQRMLLTTGRVSSEMLQKAVRLGAAAIVSRTAPTSLSVKLAEQAGVTLVGYARRERFNVYTHPERIQDPGIEASRQRKQDASS